MVPLHSEMRSSSGYAGSAPGPSLWEGGTTHTRLPPRPASESRLGLGSVPSFSGAWDSPAGSDSRSAPARSLAADSRPVPHWQQADSSWLSQDCSEGGEYPAGADGRGPWEEALGRVRRGGHRERVTQYRTVLFWGRKRFAFSLPSPHIWPTSIKCRPFSTRTVKTRTGKGCCS